MNRVRQLASRGSIGTWRPKPREAANTWRDAGQRRSGLLPWLGWRFSLLFPIALALLAVTLLLAPERSPKLLTIDVVSEASGDPVPIAHVIIGSDVYVADDGGRIVVERPEEGGRIIVEADGFAAMAGQVGSETGDWQQVTLRPSTLSGTVTDAGSGVPIAGATLTVLDGGGAEVATATTDAAGSYRFANVPAVGRLSIDAGRYGTTAAPLDGQASRDVRMALSQASGVVLNVAGEPIQGAIVESGGETAVSTGDGSFTIAGVGDNASVTISASGYASVEATVSNGAVAEVRLQPQAIKGVYANWSALTTPGALDDLIEIANTTEVNAIVIDVKQDTVYYDSQVQFFRDAGTVNPIMDIEEVIQKLKDNDIYAIARMVVFQDPLVANARPDLAVKDVSGGLWVNEMGVAWVSAFHDELWDANIALATELVDLGMDEIQYDYVRFPSDGDLTTADFGVDYTAEARETAITEFVKRSSEAIHASGGKLAADLFGFVTIVDDEQYIGQRFSALEPYLDYVCMMIYPSHFSEGNIASAPGHPNDYPYETILESLQRAEQNAPGSKAKFRPWLQDFSYGFNGLRDYDADDIRAQIDAAEKFGASGWLLWGDPFNVTVAALKPELES